jgi:hypothetical protein
VGFEPGIFGSGGHNDHYATTIQGKPSFRKYLVYAVFFMVQKWHSESGWPDWVSFRLLDDCSPTLGRFIKITEVDEIFGLLFYMDKVMY